MVKGLKLMPSTATTPADALCGKQVKLWPYARGFYRRDLWYQVWVEMEVEGALPKVLHGSFAAPSVQEPIDYRGDLADVVTYFSQPSRMVFIVSDLTGKELAGVVWFDEIITGHRAMVSVWYRKAFWGEASLEGTRLAINSVAERFQVKTFWGITPWRPAVTHAKRLGFVQLATIPGIAVVQGQDRDLYILRLVKES